MFIMYQYNSQGLGSLKGSFLSIHVWSVSLVHYTVCWGIGGIMCVCRWHCQGWVGEGGKDCLVYSSLVLLLHYRGLQVGCQVVKWKFKVMIAK